MRKALTENDVTEGDLWIIRRYMGQKGEYPLALQRAKDSGALNKALYDSHIRTMIIIDDLTLGVK